MKKTALSLALFLWIFGAVNAFALNPALLAAGGKSGDAPSATETPQLPENLSAAEIDALMARLNDDQVRRLLIAELQADAAAQTQGASEKVGGLKGAIQWLENATQLYISRAYRLVVSLPDVPGDLKGTLDRLTDYEGLGRLMVMIFIALCLLATGWVAEKIFFRFTSGLRQRIETMPGMEGILRFWGALINALPECLGLLIFAVTPLLVSSLVVDRQDRNMRLLFLAFLMVAVIIRVCALVLRLFFSPKAANLRLLPLSCPVAQYLHRRLLLMVNVVTVSWVLGILLLHLEVNRPVQVWFFIVLGSLIIVMFAGMVWSNRHIVKNYYLDRRHIACEKRVWLREQFASMWHILAIAYLFLVWLLAHWRVVTADEIKFDGTYILSLLIVPIYLALDRMAQWCVISVFSKKKPATKGSDPSTATERVEVGLDSQGDEDAAESPSEDGPAYLDIASRVVRVVVFIAVALWFLDIWGFNITFGEAAVGAVVDVLITLLLAHIAWEFITSAINRKLAEGGYVEGAENKDDDDEWGAGGSQDRSHTLLPMLRKFLGVVMVVMVTLIVLSSIGVEIGPLLAGAGVIGLAIGFGAQKLVRDILSGIFFLMDDAFRVGEYLDAGGISGTVEQITLRTIKLRHHRGMLQIVPLGDLASITNYMRGGIVVKFDLQLPYDTDIDKVRKIIKKVGKAMLLDEELGPDFIKPVKSQGVRSVGDSVMTFRVKFTARPGKHFVIRREAFKRITEALEKKGFQYAHRKVIVDLAPGAISPGGPDGGGAPALSPEQREQMLQAGAAAALDSLIDQESQDPKAGKKKQKNEIL
ncbi:MAG: mechanosensitive ion channel [Desulfobacterales bacterium]|nr:mechanosensitive ion channel [Desulfobacterales bacterium]